MNITKTMWSALLLLGMCLIAACSDGDNTPATTTTSTSNATVVANAGSDQSVFIGTFVTLNGSNSTNANGTGLTYAWTMNKPAGSNAALSNPNIVNPTFTPDIDGTFQCTLVVSNAQNLSMTSAPSMTTITAAGTNPPPMAKVGTTSLNAFPGRPIVLNGSGSSDANGDSITFLWSIAGKPSGSSPTLFDAGTVAPSFTADVAGSYILNLVVNDGTNSSTPASVTINASDKPSPTANAGPDQFVLPTIGSVGSVTLNGSSSQTNPAGEKLTYEWKINSSTFLTSLITTVDSPIASFSVPQTTAGTVVAQLKVTEPNHPDATRNTALDTVMVTVGPQAVINVFKLLNTTPIYTCDVNACPSSTTVVVNTAIILDSTESLVQPLTNLWSVISPPSGWTLANPTSSRATFTPTVVGTPYAIQLKVSESNDLTKSTTQSFTILAKVGASADFTVSPPNPGSGVVVTLNPTITADPDLTYTWGFVPPLPAGSSAALSSTTARNPFFTADKPGDYTVTLTVKDGKTNDVDSRTKTIRANTKPTAVITLPSPLSVCSIVTLSGTSSSDSDGSVAAYFWTLAPPVGSNSTFLDTFGLNSALPAPTFKADKQSSYTASLVVTDNLGLPSNADVRNFTPIPNPTGKDIYDTNGLPGMGSVVFGTGTGPSCQACHAAGSYDPAPSPSGFDLSGAKYTVAFITDKLTPGSGHTGGTTTLTVSTTPTFSSQIIALRQFLDSTLSTGCP